MTAEVAGVAAAFALFAAALGVMVTVALRWSSSRHQSRLSRLTSVEFVELFLFVEPKQFLRLNLLAVIVLPVIAFFLLGAGVAAAVLLLVIFAPTLAYRWLRTRRRAALIRQLPDVAAALSSALRAGLSLSHALEQVVKFQPRPSSQEFSLMLREHRLGVPLDRALWALAHRAGTRDFHVLVSTLGIARDLGGGLAEALERFSSMLRRRLALEDRIRALTAQGRLQGLIMGALPIFLGGVLLFMEPETMTLLYREPVGWTICGIVIALEAVGFVLIRRIVNIEV
jgi:tight adherence protein B